MPVLLQTKALGRDISQPRYQSGHPAYHLLILSEKLFSGSKHKKHRSFHCANSSTGQGPVVERKCMRQTRIKHHICQAGMILQLQQEQNRSQRGHLLFVPGNAIARRTGFASTGDQQRFCFQIKSNVFGIL